MSIPKIYLETTMFNFPVADDSPQYRDDTRKLSEEIKAGKFEPYTHRYAPLGLKVLEAYLQLQCQYLFTVKNIRFYLLVKTK
jgi:hypothetical protein